MSRRASGASLSPLAAVALIGGCDEERGTIEGDRLVFPDGLVCTKTG